MIDSGLGLSSWSHCSSFPPLLGAARKVQPVDHVSGLLCLKLYLASANGSSHKKAGTYSNCHWQIRISVLGLPWLSSLKDISLVRDTGLIPGPGKFYMPWGQSQRSEPYTVGSPVHCLLPSRNRSPSAATKT